MREGRKGKGTLNKREQTATLPAVGVAGGRAGLGADRPRTWTSRWEPHAAQAV